MSNLTIKLAKIFKEILAVIIRYSGVSKIIKNTLVRNKVTILHYHDPNPYAFDKHLNYLSKLYNFTTLNLLIEAMYKKNWNIIPQKSLIITIDDGNKNNFKILEIIKKYNVIPTIYICSQIVNTKRHFWFKEVEKKNLEKLKKYSNRNRLKYLKIEYGFTSFKEYPLKERQALNDKEILLMKGHVDFQSHSCFHPCLTTCSADECKSEILQSKKDIEAILDRECKHFSYPNGDYSNREIEFLKQAGYLSARTTDLGWNDLYTNPYKLKSIEISNNASINLLAAKLSCITIYLRFILKGSFNGKKPTIMVNS